MEVIMSEVSEKVDKVGTKISWLTLISLFIGCLTLIVDIVSFVGIIPAVFIFIFDYSFETLNWYFLFVPPFMALLSVLVACGAVIRTVTKPNLRNWLGWAIGSLVIAFLAFFGAVSIIIASILSEAL